MPKNMITNVCLLVEKAVKPSTAKQVFCILWQRPGLTPSRKQ